jgi:hypothetical protein
VTKAPQDIVPIDLEEYVTSPDALHAPHVVIALLSRVRQVIGHPISMRAYARLHRALEMIAAEHAANDARPARSANG